MSTPADHFDITPWGPGAPHPRPLGSLAEDNYDPTYGSNGVTLTAQVYECLTCGAGVINIESHVKWHDRTDTP